MLSDQIVLDVSVYTHLGGKSSLKGSYTAENYNFVWNLRNEYHIKVYPTMLKDYYTIEDTKMLIYEEDFDINYIEIEKE